MSTDSCEQRAEKAEARLARVEAIHQPTGIPRWGGPGVGDKRVLVCTHRGCGGWPCVTHLAIHDETPETCGHTR